MVVKVQHQRRAKEWGLDEGLGEPDTRKSLDSLLYILKPIQQVMRSREKEFLAKLKSAATQRKWAQR